MSGYTSAKSIGRNLAIVVGAALGLAAGAPAAGPTFYRYVDERGVVHFTDTPRDHRFKAVRVSPRAVERVRASARVTHAYDGLIAQAAQRYDLPPSLLKAVVATESNFDPWAVSPKGAAGLMQLMPETAARLGLRDPFRLEGNLLAGARYLRLLLDRYGDWGRTLAAYNAGPRAVDRYGGIPPYRETQEYVRRVLDYYRRSDGDFER